MTMHLKDDDLVLHYYGEMEPATEAAATAHLAECPACRSSYASLQRVLAAVDAAPDPALPDHFERTVWARLEPALPARRSGWTAWLHLTPARLALAAALLLVVGAAFMAGRLSRELPSVPAGTPQMADAHDDLRERILLMELTEHLDRSQRMLVELAASENAEFDVSGERERAEELVAANRLYRQTAAAAGDVAVSELLDQLERLLVDLAASPDTMTPADMDAVRSRIDAEGLLFRVRVLSSKVRARQQEQIRMRAGQSS